MAAMLPSMMIAQEADYNKWSVSIDAGANKSFRNFSPGYDSETPGLVTVNAGLRYMVNPKFGFMGDVGFSNLKSSDTSLPFDNQYFRGSFQMVTNLSNVLDARNTWLKNFGLLLHFGAGLSLNNSEAPQVDNRDWMANMIVGITPQVKLSERISLKADISLIGHMLQDFGWEGVDVNELNTEFLDGGIITTTFGLEVALGGKDKHADWADANPYKKEMEAMREKIANIETDLQDSDQDGVPDYLDREPNSINGVSVNTKGITEDSNRNGIPDEFETALDRKFVTQEDFIAQAPVSYEDALKKLIVDGYINVYFNTASATPTVYSADSVNYLVTYLTNNPTATGELIGYADKRGSDAYNANLSAKRANKIYDLLIEAGISADRLTHRGSGEEPSGDSKTSLQLRRKVTFKLN